MTNALDPIPLEDIHLMNLNVKELTMKESRKIILEISQKCGKQTAIIVSLNFALQFCE
jgi:hypothetical protein